MKRTSGNKRVLAMLLALVMCIGMLPMSALAARRVDDEIAIEAPEAAQAETEKAEQLELPAWGPEGAEDPALELMSDEEESIWTGTEWNSAAADLRNVSSLRVGQEDARTSFFAFKTEEDALASQQVGKDRDLSRAAYQSLDTAAGNVWKFYYVAYPYARKTRPDNENIMKPDYDDTVKGWDEITVPSTWEFTYNEDKTFKYNPPHYSNTDNPWAGQNPNPSRGSAPTQFNPVGFYRTKFTVDDSLKGKNIFLNFDGVQSALYVWVNGHQVGFGMDSFTTKEFKVDEYLVDGENTLAVEVFKWSSGSWVEDQDMLRLSGIFRSVYLTAKENVEIRDYTIVPTHAGFGNDPDVDYEDFDLNVYVNLRDLGATTAERTGLKVEMSLYDAEGKKLGSEMIEGGRMSAAVKSTFTNHDSLGRPTTVVRLSATVKNPEKWSAENPYLYKAVLTLRDSANNIIETTAHRFGFRDLAIADQGTDHAKVLLNGQPLLIKGVNTQEIHPTEGRALSSETIRWDLTMMKQNNFNAVRMSHYSHDFRYYDIADELGLYVMEEANLENHADGGISDDGNFKLVYLERVSNMYYRSKNYPSVIILSLGNEAGGGGNHQQTSNWLNGIYAGNDFYQDGMPKGDLQNRPIHYEGNCNYADIQSSMYARVGQIDGASNASRKPYLLMEYAHSLGNAMGFYQEYWDAFERNSKNIMGGFIWDWVDQAALTYQTPDSFPPQREAGGTQELVSVSQDALHTRTQLNAGINTLGQPGVSGEAGDTALRGVAEANATPDELNLNGAMTLEAWVKPEADPNGVETIMGKGDNQYTLRAYSGIIDFQVKSSSGWHSFGSGAPLPSNWVGQWHHIVAQYEPATKTGRVFVDNMAEPALEETNDQIPSNGMLNQSSAHFAVGTNTDARDRSWKGLIDNVRVYNRVLTAEELQDETRTADGEGVVYWEDFNDLRAAASEYYMASQDSNEIELQLWNGLDALTAGRTGEDNDKALASIAVAAKRPEALDLNSDLTLEVWFKPTTDSRGMQTLIAKGDNQYQLKTEGGQVRFVLYGVNGGGEAQAWNTFAVDYNTDGWVGSWHHVVARYDHETMTATLFIDDMETPAKQGELEANRLHPDGTFSKSTAKFAVGRNTSYPGSRDWVGLIDDVHIYNRALTDEEIKDETRTADGDGVVYWEDFNGEPTTELKPNETPTIVEEGYWGFGGDWGDTPNSDNFCANGIVSPDRVLRGSVLEVKRVHQDYVMELDSATATSAVIDIRSRARFTNASAYDFVWQIKEDGTTIRSGKRTFDLEPMQSGKMTISFEEITPKDGKEYLLTAKFQLKDDTAWAPAGWEVSAAQFDLGYKSTPVLPTDLAELPDLAYTETDSAYTVTGEDFTITLDRAKGSIRSFIYKGTELFAQDGEDEDVNGPIPNFWRAPTDNDRSSMGHAQILASMSAWRFAGRDRSEVTTTLEPVVSAEESGKAKAVKISVGGDLGLAPSEKYRVGTATYAMVFTIYANGQVLIENNMTPSGFGYLDDGNTGTYEQQKHIIPAVGNLLKLPAGFDNLTWFGQGSDTPGIISESYEGREEQQFVDVFSGKVSEQSDRYTKPQTSGNKMGTRWVALTNDAGRGLMASGVSAPFQFNAQHKTPEMLTTLGSNHPYEVPEMEEVSLTIDTRQLGVGYDPGWLTEAQYQNRPDTAAHPYQEFNYSYMLTPVDGFTVEKAFEDSSRSFVDGSLSDQELVAQAKLAAGSSVEIPGAAYPDKAAEAEAAASAVQAKISNGVSVAVTYETDHFVLTLTKGEVSETVDPFAVTVAVAHITGVRLDQNAANVTVGSTVKLTAVVEPDSAANKNVVWSSSDETVATVDENGVVTGVAEGTATITVTTVDGGLMDQCAVSVSRRSTGGTTGGGSSTPSDTTKTETREDGSTVTTVTKPDGSKTVTVEQPDGSKAETVITKDGAVTITANGPEGEEIAKVEIPAAIPESAVKFDDIDQTPWAVESINKMAGLELVKGTGGNQYSPMVPMTRGALATALHRLSQGKTDYEVTFKDVAQGKYYTEGVAWAAKTGVVKGFSEDIFAPDQIITREQLATMLCRYAKLIGMDTKADAHRLNVFADGDTTGDWAVNGVAWCVQNGILKGKGQNNLDPTADVTRAEVAVMLDRFIALLK